MKYWTRAWSLVEGCTYVSPGCANCWSAEMTHRKAGQSNPKIQARYGGLTDAEGRWTGEIRLMDRDMLKPVSWRQPQVVAIWNDLFHEEVPLYFIRQAFGVMQRTPRHAYLAFTKRPKRVMEFCDFYGLIPPGNVWPIISAENQEWLERRLAEAMQIPAPLVVNLEPLLGPVNLMPWLRPWPGCEFIDPEDGCCGHPMAATPECHIGSDCPVTMEYQGIKGVLCGGESGRRARVMQAEWPWALRDQCVAAGVDFFFKQWGEYYPTSEYRDGKRFMARARKIGRALDGQNWDLLPWRSVSHDLRH